jgi:putative ABC transport system permease protein
MNISQNIQEGIKSITKNKLRTGLTSLIIAIGITSLVGILTAIEGIKQSISNSFESLGANTFEIASPQPYGRRSAGRESKLYPKINYHQALEYSNKISEMAETTISTQVTGAAEVKYNSKKTNPNTSIIGADNSFLQLNNLEISNGRNFNNTELTTAENVAIIGNEINNQLFKNIDGINEKISIFGLPVKIIGILKKKGGLSNGTEDRQIILPLQTARNLAGTRKLNFELTTFIPSIINSEKTIGEATGIMRAIRNDQPGQENSFQITKPDSFSNNLNDITDKLKIGGFAIGFITLLGASIALMNIMLVSVTERTKEIGIRKSLGATSRNILIQFLFEAIIICIFGGLLGLFLGLQIGNTISKVISESNTFVIPWLWMITGLIISIIVGIISGIAPAIKASKLDPIEALRHE